MYGHVRILKGIVGGKAYESEEITRKAAVWRGKKNWMRLKNDGIHVTV